MMRSCVLPESGWPVQVSVVFDILLNAHSRCSYLLLYGVHLLLLVNHAASCSAVHSLTCVHALCFQILD